MIYPWLQPTLAQWRERLLADRKPQALIIHGNEGIGKGAFTDAIVAELMCRQPSPEPCGECQSCRLLASGHHPDLIKLEPEKGLIKVKDIRRLVAFFVSTAHSGKHKLAVIADAETMNKAAANALLKVLEEPPASGLLILQTAQMHHLLPTIRSRCLQLQITLDSNQQESILSWLKERHSVATEELNWVMTVSDGLPLIADSLLNLQMQNTFISHLDQLLEYLEESRAVTDTADYLMKNLDWLQWQLLQRYLMAYVKHQWQPNNTLIWTQHPLTSWLRKQPDGISTCLKMCELINQIMVNLTSQVKTQLQIESMLVTLKQD